MQIHNGPPTTYFQQPPPPPKSRLRRVVVSVVWSAAFCYLGAFLQAQATLYDSIDLEEDLQDRDLRTLALRTGQLDSLCRTGAVLDAKHASLYLAALAAAYVVPKGIVHAISVPSNPICEDTFNALCGGTPPLEQAGRGSVPSPQFRMMVTLGIYDGHAGARTSYALKQYLSLLVLDRLMAAGCMGHDYEFKPNDALFVNTIKEAFTALDARFMSTEHIFADPSEAIDHPTRVTAASQAFSGSCALLALYDPTNSILRVANTGDSRAVLGRWDHAKQRYIAKAMSQDHTGFNEKEVERLAREHPGETVIDPSTGRVHGIAVSRAFGDSRWKWANELSKKAQQLYWGPAPRPDHLIKTPPYLTAEPEITETKINGSDDYPDFLIMASDGLWDNISSDDAVTCVQMWLDKFHPSDAARQHSLMLKGPQPAKPPPIELTSDAASDDFEDTYFDTTEGCLKWRVSPKHFVVEDSNCAAHLVKNALGGRRRGLFGGIMSVTPPLSRLVRDDITIQVLFFGQDDRDLLAEVDAVWAEKKPMS
nr:protein phosphatase 2c like c10f6.17c [Quercus suber]